MAEDQVQIDGTEVDVKCSRRWAASTVESHPERPADSMG
jgi:hypothetical protein